MTHPAFDQSTLLTLQTMNNASPPTPQETQLNAIRVLLDEHNDAISERFESRHAAIDVLFQIGTERMDANDVLTEQTRVAVDEVKAAVGTLVESSKANGDVIRETRDLLAAGKTVIKVSSLMGRAVIRSGLFLGKLAAAMLAFWGLWFTFTHGGQPPKG